MKAILTVALAILSSTALFAQMSSRKEAKKTSDDQVQLLIVRNSEECLGYESSVYELISEERKKVAVLYHDADNQSVATNFQNLNTIRDILQSYSLQGYSIQSTEAENMGGRCNRQLTYTLIKRAEYIAEK